MDQGGELRIKFFTRLSKYAVVLPLYPCMYWHIFLIITVLCASLFILVVLILVCSHLYLPEECRLRTMSSV